MSQFLNQFEQAPVKGALNKAQNFNVLNVQVSSAQVADITPGEAVQLSDVASSVPVVETLSAVTDAFFGIALTDTKTDAKSASQMMKIAYDNSLVVLEASAAIVPGAQVEYDPATKKVATQSTGTVIGYATQKATADGDLIEVLIKSPQKATA